jgi:lipase chaperone LimK
LRLSRRGQRIPRREAVERTAMRVLFGGSKQNSTRSRQSQPARFLMACEDLVAQCFMDEQAPLAVPELNRERTLKFLECCYQQGLSWEDAKQQIQALLQQRGVPHQGIVRQLQLAKPLLQPWLD